MEDRVDGASGTGLTYLNARYYDPATMRFLSPDPLMNPGDPKTLDPYRYADNNPVVFTDATGLYSTCQGYGYNKMMACVLKSRAAEVKLANPGILTTVPSTGARSKWYPANARIAKATGEYLSLMARAADIDWRSNASGLQPGAQWAAGGRVLTSPGNFYDGDRIVESLKQSDHYQFALPGILAQRESEGNLHEGLALGGPETYYQHAAGAPWWAKASIASRDMQAALTGEQGGTYNEALTFLGSHSVDMTVRSVERQANDDGSTTVRVSVGIVARNNTTVESFARAGSDEFGRFVQSAYDLATGGNPTMPASTRGQELRFSMSYVFTTGAG